MGGEIKIIRRDFRDRLARVRRIFARATAWPFLVRLGVFGLALVAQGFAYPSSVLTGTTVIVLVALALLPALWPRTAAVSTFWLLTVAGWVAATTLYGAVATLPRLAGLAVALYLVHSGAALAAALPYDAVVDPVAIVRWLLRAMGVLVVSVGGTVAAMLYVGQLTPRSYLVATLIGFALTVVIAWLIALAARIR
jgi:hypothetical protein